VTNSTEIEVRIEVGDVVLAGDLVTPEDAIGVVVFAHGSGSSRHSPRNRFVAKTLNGARIGTLLIDLLTREEEVYDRATGELRFDVALLANRLIAAIDWLHAGPAASLRFGLFGALVAAAERPDDIAAIVSRGGRPDLAAGALPRVRAPTLLIVGSLDGLVLELNQQALEQLRAEKQLVVVTGATHLFEEPGALDEVARLATDWFSRHFAGGDAQ
jgi:putative phosphoribosyl transferase